MVSSPPQIMWFVRRVYADVLAYGENVGNATWSVRATKLSAAGLALSKPSLDCYSQD